MNDEFLLDPDYKDFEFTDKEKLKFSTISGEQYETFAGAIFILIGYSVFVLILFFGFASEWRWLWNSEHADGVVVKPCSSSNNWYSYSFEAEDKDGSRHLYTGTTSFDKYTPCRKLGDSVQVDYLTDNPNTSREITSRSSSHLTILCVIGFMMLYCGYHANMGFRNLRAILPARSKYNRLKTRSIIIGGTITSVNKFMGDTSSRGYYIEVGYEFVVNNRVFSGTQVKRREDLKNKYRLPPPGTPVRVLYADENTYVML